MVVVNPAPADAMHAGAVEILPGRQRNPEHRQLVIVHLDVVEQAETLLQRVNDVLLVPIPARAIVQRPAHLEAIGTEEVPVVVLWMKDERIRQGPLANRWPRLVGRPGIEVLVGGDEDVWIAQ